MKNYLNNMKESHYGFLYHYYRAEVYRETNWRGRLDVTTNWAIVTTAGILSFVFSAENISHVMILINYILVIFLLFIEARRFRYYSILKKRTRLIEEHILAPMFLGDTFFKEINGKWLKKLGEYLIKPIIPISRRESIAWRLRRNYMFILPFIFSAWLVKLSMTSVNTTSMMNVIQQGYIWHIPGEVVCVFFLASIFIFLGIAIYIPEHSSSDDLP